MAYTSVRVAFELGHEASIRDKTTSQGFTHDWEVFVRGAENTEIHHYVEKVVFHLHDTFPNPKRVLKDPPYVVRESGYAGFSLPVDIYLKTKQDPFRLRYKYHLTLQDSGPPISNIIKEKFVFKNPSEDFRRKLIRGGGVGVGVESASGSLTNHMAALNSDHSTDDHKNFVSNKNKSSPQDGVAKKSKKESTPKNDDQLSASDPFSIFGQPIKTSKIPLVSKSTKPISDKTPSQPEKQTHSSKSSKHSSSSHKDRDKEKDRGTEKTKEKDKDRDKNAVKKSKEEPKKDKKEEKVKIVKTSKDDSKKNVYHEEKSSKEKPVEKLSERAEKEVKSEKKDKEKKHKDEKKSKTKEKHKNNEKKENIEVKESYERSESFKDDFREEKKTHKINAEEKDEKMERMGKEKPEPKNLFSNANVNNVDNQSVVNNGDNIRREEKHKHHKHKKDKSKKDSKREKEERKEKKEIKENKEKRSPMPVEPPRSTPKSESPKRIKKPLKTLFEELSGKSDSDLSSLDDEPSERLVMKESISPEMVKEEPITFVKQEEQKQERESGKKKKKNIEDRENKKRKRKTKDKDENSVKMTKYDNSANENNIKQMEMEHVDQRPSSMSPASETKFTDEYVTKLKELQRKIMTLEDNSGLQRIVQVVAETGQYEITTKTFDFDLCSLDESIVQRLLDFFVP